MRHLTFVGLTAIVWGSFATGAAAQYGYAPRGNVGGTGVVTLKRQPDRMRMHIMVMSRGSDLKQALSGLSERTAAAEAQLAALGAAKDSIKFGDPQISTQADDQRRQIEQMIAENLRRSGRAQKTGDKPRPVTVVSTLTAEWPLQTADPSELLIHTHELQDKIRQADISGSAEASKLTPEEEEIMEEAEGMFSRYSSSDEPKPGEPVFSFASPISDDDYEQALADAFQKAKANAARIAKATGGELGKLEFVHGDDTNSMENGGYSYRYDSPSYQAYQMLQSFQSRSNTEEKREAIGVQPGEVAYSVTVSAGFGLKE